MGLGDDRTQGGMDRRRRRQPVGQASPAFISRATQRSPEPGDQQARHFTHRRTHSLVWPWALDAEGGASSLTTHPRRWAPKLPAPGLRPRASSRPPAGAASRHQARFKARRRRVLDVPPPPASTQACISLRQRHLRASGLLLPQRAHVSLHAQARRRFVLES